MKHVTALLLAMAFFCTGAAQASEAKDRVARMHEPITIQGDSKRMAVVFNHSSHKAKGITCIHCHHESPVNMPFVSCSDENCHATPGARERDTMSMYMAYHAKDTDRSCVGCHTQLAAQSPKSYPGFKGCRPCHSSQKVAK